MQTSRLIAFYSAALLLAVCPALGHAQPPREKQNVVARKIHQPAAKTPDRYREIYWITNETATGSHLPVVYRILQRNGQILSITPMNTLTPNRVLRNAFGASDVSSILRQEPAFH